MRSATVALALSLICTAANSQELSVAARGARGSVPFPFSLVVPADMVAGLDLRRYVESPEFGMFDSSHRPEIVFDEIYYTALDYTHGDSQAAMLASMIATTEHEAIPFHLFGIHITIPLTTESRSRFASRVSHLPTHLYHTPEDDRDKLQHFFGSAWIRRVFGIDWIANAIGSLIETGEGLFVEESDDDPRDLHADRDGIRFSTNEAAGLDDRSSWSPPSKSLTRNP